MHKESGQVLILSLIIAGLVIIHTLLIASGSLTFFQSSGYSLAGIQADYLAEAGIDKAIASLNKTGGSYAGEAETVIGGGAFEVSITNVDAATKIVKSTGYVPSKSKPVSKKTITINVSKGNGVAFNYAIQTGNGGFEMGNSSVVNGNLYSNGNIILGNNARINGDVYVAGGVQPVADTQVECSEINCADYDFGKSIAGQNRLSVAQSFRVSSANVLSKISVKLKKFGNPANLTVRIMTDGGGKPSKTALATGTLTANLVTSTYSFVDVGFLTTPNLTANTTYWLMLTAPADSNLSNYWDWQMDSSNPYTCGGVSGCGTPAWSPNWNASTPVWTATTGDLNFRTYLGGVPTSITGAPGTLVTGDVHANSILSTLTIQKNAYYQVISPSVIAAGFFPNSTDPAPTVLPISDAQVGDWQTTATAAGSFGGLNGCQANLPSGKYVGNVSLSNSCVMNAQSPIWITGDFTLSNSNRITLNPTFGTASGVIIVDGVVNIGNGNIVQGTGSGSSQLIILSTYDSPANGGVNAISINNAGNQVILYAGKGYVSVGNGNVLEQLTAYKVILSNGVTLNYNSGYSSQFFSSGPSGAFTVVKGTLH